MSLVDGLRGLRCERNLVLSRYWREGPSGQGGWSGFAFPPKYCRGLVQNPGLTPLSRVSGHLPPNVITDLSGLGLQQRDVHRQEGLQALFPQGMGLNIYILMMLQNIWDTLPPMVPPFLCL